jgi:hypothetical protein
MSGAKRAVSAASGACDSTQMSSMLALPQVPHALVVMKLRRAPGASSTPTGSNDLASRPGDLDSHVGGLVGPAAQGVVATPSRPTASLIRNVGILRP